jgi:hypothetical protein
VSIEVASLPRRHTTSAAGALALALLLAVQARTLAQDAARVLSRETAGLSDGWQVMGTPAAGPAQDLPADN